MSAALDLTVAIPVHNDRDPLLALLGELRCATRIVVVDDGSEQPLQQGDLCAAAGLPPERLTLLRHDSALGAGAARNAALAQVQTDYLLYLDADDLPTRELPLLLADLEGQDFDFCIFRHHDSRSEQENYWGPDPHDRALWRAAGSDIGALTPVGPAAAAQLVQTANYPWNKIYRTGFLRDHGIRCSRIPVHEDIELHWRSFLNARRILASDRIAAIHFVTPGGNRLTNALGPDRLRVFEPLTAIADEISTTGVDPLPFARFTVGLLGWIHDHLHPELRPGFADRAQAFLNAPANPALRSAIDDTRPGLRADIAALLQADPP
ncbi:glycosyltransferase family 2 protein [Sedimentitalea nanhaiensis]|uniref:Glycosyltransferase involved in cell wall bisynthesis n=1 Tax=Sedimentitalea nanhaiensis TaxID=999627 RepID=A0A1I7EBU5_9RHOB|nr:glycosyltransferase [Sedimentitalea nanhaiensis]SFU21335.1 Glycosyltransferase involved in cell wall bisynthesis [Sedimentitalea nanhaiensis]